MKKILFLISAILLLSSCKEPVKSETPAPKAATSKETEVAKQGSPECSVTGGQEMRCTLASGGYSVNVSLNMQSVSEAEWLIEGVNISRLGSKQNKTIAGSEGVSLFTGDILLMRFQDINFDGIPDLAVSTSFGVANLYFDYWLSDSGLSEYEFIGNYPELKIDSKNKELKSNVRVNAAVYESKTWHWVGGKLTPR